MPSRCIRHVAITLLPFESLLNNLWFFLFLADLHAIGGLVPLLNYLKNPNAGIRSRAAEVVSTIVQNNPKSQQQVMECNGLEKLLANFNSDDNMKVRTKALGAISCTLTCFEFICFIYLFFFLFLFYLLPSSHRNHMLTDVLKMLSLIYFWITSSPGLFCVV